MFTIEKGKEKLNIFELLFLMKDMPIGKVNNKKIYEDLKDIVVNKHVVFYYVGQLTFGLLKYHSKSICSLLSDLCHIIENTSDFIMFWYDDGTLKKLVQNGDNKGNGKIDAEAYEELIEDIQQSKAVIRIEPHELEHVIDCIDVYYGDESNLMNLFKKCKIDIIMQDFERQNLIESSNLQTWLDRLNDNGEREIIQIPKRGNQNVVIYYMQPQMVLVNGEKAIAKLERIVSMFSKRKDLLLCWMEEIDSKKYLDLLEEEKRERYIAVRETIKRIGNVMSYDKSRNNAIGDFDVYYGDDSFLYDDAIHRGMPAIHQFYECHVSQHNPFEHSERGFGLQFVSYCTLEDYYYFPALNGNALCRVAKGSKDVQFVSFIPCKFEKSNRYNLFCYITEYNNKLFLLPLAASEIMVFDVSCFSWHSIALSDEYHIPGHNKSFFGSGIRRGNKLWGLPVTYTSVICLDLESELISYYCDWSHEILPYVDIPNSMHWTGVGVFEKDRLWFGSSQSRHIVGIDTQTKKYEVYELDIDSQGIGNIVYDGKWFWISTARKGAGDVIKWHPDTGIKSIERNFMGKENNACAICAFGDYIWGFTSFNDCYVKYNILTGEKTYKEHFLTECASKSLGLASLGVEDGHICIYPNWGDLFIRIDGQSEKIEVRNFMFDEKNQENFLKYNMSGTRFDEADFFSDDELLTYMGHTKHMDNIVETAGKKIYHKILNLY